MAHRPLDEDPRRLRRRLPPRPPVAEQAEVVEQPSTPEATTEGPRFLRGRRVPAPRPEAAARPELAPRRQPFAARNVAGQRRQDEPRPEAVPRPVPSAGNRPGSFAAPNVAGQRIAETQRAAEVAGTEGFVPEGPVRPPVERPPVARPITDEERRLAFGEPESQPEPAAITLSGSNQGTFANRPDAGADPTLPPDTVTVIKGTDVFYNTADGVQFPKLPGKTFKESADAAAAQDPGLKFLLESELERGRQSISRISALAQQTNAEADNRTAGFNDEGKLVLFGFDENGQAREIPGVMPIVDALIAPPTEFVTETIQAVNPSNPELLEDQTIIREKNKAEGVNLTNKSRTVVAVGIFIREGGNDDNKTVEERLEILDRIEEQFPGALLQFRIQLQQLAGQ